MIAAGQPSLVDNDSYRELYELVTGPVVPRGPARSVIQQARKASELLAAARDLRRRLAVDMRAEGYTLAVIGECMGISLQAVAKLTAAPAKPARMAPQNE